LSELGNKSELGISLKRSTLSDILKNEDKFANAPDSFYYRDRKVSCFRRPSVYVSKSIAIK